MAERLCEAAESMPTAFGLSHDVSDWEGHVNDQGVYVVTAINKVASVDLVSDPGSTNGLFESHRQELPVKKKKQKLATWVAGQADPIKSAFRKLLESDMMAGGPLMAGDDDPMAAVGNAFLTGMMSVLGSSAESKIKLQKVGAILAAQDDLIASGAFTPTEATDPVDDTEDVIEADETVDDDSTDDPKKDEVVESLRQEVETLKRRDACRRLCESMGVTPTPMQLKALERLDNDNERKAFLRESGTPARSAGGTGGGTRRNGDGPRDVKDFAKRIKR